jgi:hypothetical protein
MTIFRSCLASQAKRAQERLFVCREIVDTLANGS